MLALQLAANTRDITFAEGLTVNLGCQRLFKIDQTDSMDAPVSAVSSVKLCMIEHLACRCLWCSIWIS